MNRLLALALIVVAAGELRAADKPNIVLILCDDLGWADLGCYGSKYHKTPHLDRFAAAGVRFTDAYAACPVCSPTRASLLTGHYPQRYNLTDWLPGRPDRPDQKLLRPKINQQLAAGGNHARGGAQAGGLRQRPHRQMAPRRQGLRSASSRASMSTSPATRPARRAAISPLSRARMAASCRGWRKLPTANTSPTA